MQKLLEQAQCEYEDYSSSSPTPRPKQQIPEPAALSKKEQLMAKKMEMFKEIQERFCKDGQKKEDRSKIMIQEDEDS